jgi:hypothetical protein
MDCPRGVTVTRFCQYLLEENVKSVSGWVINAPDALVVGDGGEHVIRYLTIFVHVVLTHGPLSRTGRLDKSVRRRVLSLLHTDNSAQ